jgi:photosystem II stability/assembly factor-like uncharacterized protein
MKKLFFSIILISLFNPVLYSQVTWNPQTSGTYENLNDICLVNYNTGYAVGNNGVVLKTTNGGISWAPKSFPASTNNLSVFFQNAMTGFVGNQNANIYKTVDGGNNWETNGSASTYAITSVTMTSALTGYCGDHYSNIQKSTDNGQTWWTLTTTPGYDAKLFFLNDNRGWAVDNYGYIYSTANGGYNWTNVRISTDTLSSVYFITSTIGYVAGDSGRVFKTTNGGTNWTLLNTGSTVKLNSIYVQNLNNIYASGNSGTILYSTDAGSTWTAETHGTNNLKCINFLPSTVIGTVSGDLGTIYRTYMMGISCVGGGNTPVGYPFYTYYMDSRTDMLFLASELISYGATAGTLTQLGFYFTSADTIIMNGFNIKIQHTSLTSLTGFTNTGWTAVYSGTYKVPGTGLRYINLTAAPGFVWDGTSNLLVEICFNNSVYTLNSNVYSSNAPNMTYHNHADLPSADGCVALTTSTLQGTRPNICFVTQLINSTNNNNKLVPDKFYLSQNYPNPFNPVTKIKYGLAKNSLVTLKVFDILGREIKSLVNAQMNAGEYIIDFDGSDFPSGTYFYRLETNNFTETKKLILLK